jgi:hypothetical protein
MKDRANSSLVAPLVLPSRTFAWIVKLRTFSPFFAASLEEGRAE